MLVSKSRGWAKHKCVAYTAHGNLSSRRDGDRIRQETTRVIVPRSRAVVLHAYSPTYNIPLQPRGRSNLVALQGCSVAGRSVAFPCRVRRVNGTDLGGGG